MPRVILREEDFIIKGKLPLLELELLSRDALQYADKSSKAGLVSGTKDPKQTQSNHNNIPRYDDSRRNCLTFFPTHNKYPKTINLLHSLLIENYLNIYDLLDYSDISTIQYVKYNKGHYFKKHTDLVTNINDHFRALTMSINMTDPNEYSGGDLLVYNQKDKVIDSLDKSKGSFIILPSFFPHEATEVTVGSREAIVTWLSGTGDSIAAFQDAVRRAS